MKSALIAVVLLGVGVVVAVAALTAIERQQLAVLAQQRGGGCLASIGPVVVGQPRDGAADAVQLDERQRAIAQEIISIGKRRGLPPRAWQIAIQAGMTESRLRNVDYGHLDSLGVFQMRPSMGWGTPRQVANVRYQVNKFYDVLEEVPGWRTRRPGDMAQAVERSAFPDRYHRWEAMAARLVDELGGVGDAACGSGERTSVRPNAVASKVIGFALNQRSKPYEWGAKGPDAFDCSGLTLRAYEAAGIVLPLKSTAQFDAGAKIPIDETQPGDLLFWAYEPTDPESIHHVAIYLGDDQIIEAQQPGVPVHTRTVNWEREEELVQFAVRPGA